MSRILAVSHSRIWPVRSGSAIRRLMILEALAAVGEVDLLYVGEVDGWGAAVPADSPVRAVREFPVRRVRPGALARFRWLIRPDVPLQLMEWERRAPEAGWGDYDVVWYFRPIAYELASGVSGRRVIVDLDDLEDTKLLQASALPGNRRPFHQRVAERRNVGAWRHYQRRIAEEVDAVTVANVGDRAALPVGRCHVVPNGFPDVPAIAESRPSPRLLLVGQFEYGPNADAAEFFVREIFPFIRASRPDAVVRLVGRDSRRVRRLAGDGVEVTGEVDDLAAEYTRAGVAVSPVRYGSGTRVKILEAFARGVPTVSTSIGAAGLGTVHGEHLLIADDAESFARSCIEVLTDDQLRRHLIGHAHSLLRRGYSQAAVTEAVRRVLFPAGNAAGW